MGEVVQLRLFNPTTFVALKDAGLKRCWINKSSYNVLCTLGTHFYWMDSKA